MSQRIKRPWAASSITGAVSGAGVSPNKLRRNVSHSIVTSAIDMATKVISLKSRATEATAFVDFISHSFLSVLSITSVGVISNRVTGKTRTDFYQH